MTRHERKARVRSVTEEARIQAGARGGGAFKAGGPGWQTRIDRALKKAAGL